MVISERYIVKHFFIHRIKQIFKLCSLLCSWVLGMTHYFYELAQICTLFLTLPLEKFHRANYSVKWNTPNRFFLAIRLTTYMSQLQRQKKINDWRIYLLIGWISISLFSSHAFWAMYWFHPSWEDPLVLMWCHKLNLELDYLNWILSCSSARYPIPLL